MLGQQLEWVLFEIKQLGVLDGVVGDVVFDQFEASVGHRTDARLVATGIKAVEGPAGGGGTAFQHVAETAAVVRANGRWQGKPREIT